MSDMAVMLTLFLLTCVLRLTWGQAPGVGVCLAFWVVCGVFFMAWLRVRRTITQKYSLGDALVAVGALLNAVVTIANGGRMPVALLDGMPDIGSGQSIWVPLTEQSVLVPLADILYGFSIGDVLILSGVVTWVLTWLVSRAFWYRCMEREIGQS